VDPLLGPGDADGVVALCLRLRWGWRVADACDRKAIGRLTSQQRIATANSQAANAIANAKRVKANLFSVEKTALAKRRTPAQPSSRAVPPNNAAIHAANASRRIEARAGNSLDNETQTHCSRDSYSTTKKSRRIRYLGDGNACPLRPKRILMNC